jgi:hypothetical protein
VAGTAGAFFGCTLTFATAVGVGLAPGVRVGEAVAVAAGEAVRAGWAFPHPVTLPMMTSSTTKAPTVIRVNWRGFIPGDPLLRLHCPHAMHSHDAQRSPADDAITASIEDASKYPG